MSILTNKDQSIIHVTCDCGTEGIMIEKATWSGENNNLPDQYFISFSIDAFYEKQGKWHSNITERLKIIWNILRHGTHRFYEICLSQEDMDDLKEIIKDI